LAVTHAECIQRAAESVAGRAGLRHLVLVVGESQIKTAAVNVEHRLQIAVAHGGAFDVPARAARAERGLPAGVERDRSLGRLPQREIARVVLVGGGVGRVDGIVLVVAGGVDGRAHASATAAASSDLGGLLLVRQLAVMRPGRHVEVHVAGRLAVRVA
jgi:hypothetical protein